MGEVVDVSSTMAVKQVNNVIDELLDIINTYHKNSRTVDIIRLNNLKDELSKSTDTDNIEKIIIEVESYNKEYGRKIKQLSSKIEKCKISLEEQE